MSTPDPGETLTVTTLVTACEAVIRDLAATVVNGCTTRVHHPTFVTKTAIRLDLARMEGAIGLYAVLTEQAMHATVSGLATFTDERTTYRVTEARSLAGAL